MRRIRRAFLVSTVLAGGLFGCELIVSNTVPDFKCTPGDPNACPANMACDPTSLVCVVVNGDGGGFDTGSPDAKARDAATSETGANLAAIGAPCTADSSCQDGLICGTSNTLTTTIATSSTDSICTKTCCTSADCPDDFVCYGPGTGGNYCISTARAQRGDVGAGVPGETCAIGTDCRSGVCDDDSHCLDTCCSPTDCATGTTCRVKSISTPPPPLENWVCAVPETGSKLEADAGCSGTTQTCKNDNCTGFPLKCRPPCCSSNDCLAYGFNYGVCAYGEFVETSAQTKWCFDGVDGGTLGKIGDSCGGVGDCASRFCDPDTKKCAAVCCQDSDCDQGQACRPAQSGTPFLRCINVAAQ